MLEFDQHSGAMVIWVLPVSWYVQIAKVDNGTKPFLDKGFPPILSSPFVFVDTLGSVSQSFELGHKYAKDC